METTPRNSDHKWLKWFKFEENKQSLSSRSDARNTLLVVATVIAAVTFQAGVTPPGGVWQDDEHGHKAGRAIYASQKTAYYVFLFANTYAFSSSILVIMRWTVGLPYSVEIVLATIAMFTTYASSIFAVSHDESVKHRYVIAVAFAPLVLRALIYVYKWCKEPKKLCW